MKVLNISITIRSCTRCGRRLKSQASIDRGMGAVCAGIQRRKGYKVRECKRTIDMFVAVYSCKECLHVYDLNTTKECPNCGTEKGKK